MVKMGFFFGGVFWGVFFIVLGLCAIFKTVFHVNISVIRIGLALFIIYIGLSMLFSGPHFRVDKNTVLFENRDLILTETMEEYNIIFGRGVIDLTAISTENQRTEINIVFGEGIIKVNPELPMEIKVSSVLSGAKMLDGNNIAMGEYTYRTKSYNENNAEGLLVEATVVFGKLEFIEK